MPHGRHIYAKADYMAKAKKCVHTHIKIMRYHIRNVYCDVVPKDQALIFVTKKLMISIPTPVLQLFFTFII